MGRERNFTCVYIVFPCVKHFTYRWCCGCLEPAPDGKTREELCEDLPRQKHCHHGWIETQEPWIKETMPFSCRHWEKHRKDAA